MRYFTLLFLFLSILGCTGNQEENIFNESEYVLLKTDTINNTIAKKVFVHKSDTLRKLTIEFWDNGHIMQKEFSYKGLLEGKKETYTIDGKLFGSVNYHEGVQVDTKESD